MIAAGGAPLLVRGALWVMRGGIAVVLLLPLYVAPSMVYPFVTGKAFVFRILVEALLVPWALLLALSPEHRPARSRLTAAVIVFVAVAAVADVFGVNPAHSFWSSYARMEGLNGLLHLLVFFMMLTSAITRDSEWLGYFQGSALVSVAVSVLALGEKVATGASRVSGTFGNAGHLASYLVIHVFILAFCLGRERQGPRRALLAAAIALEVVVLFFTGSRGPLIGLVIVAAVAGVALMLRHGSSGSEQLARRVAFATVALALVATAVVVVGRHSAFVRDRPLVSRLLEADSIGVRVVLWKAAWQGIQERPLRGWGQENFYVLFGRYQDPTQWPDASWADRSHNVILDRLVEAGVPGLLTYAALFVLAGWSLRRAQARGRLTGLESLTLGGLSRMTRSWR